MKILAGVDCGATHLRIGLVREDGELIGSLKTHSPLKHQPENLGIQVKTLLEALLYQHNLKLSNIDSLGIGVPGPIDFKRGTLMHSANLANPEPIKFQQIIESEVDRKVYFDRDTNIGLLGEKWVGAAKPHQDVLMLTLGTGVGGAIMINGQIYRGANGWGGEIGHSYLRADLKPEPTYTCGLGHRGCVESLIKAKLSTPAVIHYLAYEIASLAAIFNPAMIVLGGGMMFRLGDHVPSLIEQTQRLGMQPVVEKMIITEAKLGDLAGIYGAAKLCLETK